MPIPKPQKLKIGLHVEAISSGWKGLIVGKNKQKSSPWKVRWDKNGMLSNENSMSIRIIKSSY